MSATPIDGSTKGYIRLHRKLLDNPLFTEKPITWLKIETALNAAALREVGGLYSSALDPAARNRIMDDLGDRFLRTLTEAELDMLEAELRRLGDGNLAIGLDAVGTETDASNSEPREDW